MLAMFPNDAQENDCATSYEDLMSLHGDSDDEYHKRSTVLLHLDIWRIQNLNIRFKKNESTGGRQFVRCQVSNGSYFHQSLITMNLSKIKTIGLDHCWGKQRDNNTIDSGVLSKKYIEEFRINPSWGVKKNSKLK
ncbi:hypothetical protein H5410_051888 [Solanum commersonii]|uniref:Uncharacterized protein n=1 Tax=Solanum commersonii TaxID=4109 RepID=A0A9J5X1E4_SOLCO|nr:hypothetical protein H5410_051888 [Solanum commersonii]